MTPREKIRARRIELGMSQGDLAKAAGFADRSAISKIERGLSNMSPERLMDVAHALGMNPADFFDYKHLEEDPESSGILVAKIMADQELLDAIEKYYELTQEKKQLVISLINSF